MSGFIMFALLALVFVIVYQIAKASEYATIMRGEEKVMAQTNRMIGWIMLAIFFVGMWGIYKCNQWLTQSMFVLPESASVQGRQYDFMFNVTLAVTGAVFVITQALLFWFAFRYQHTEKSTAFYFPHNNKLELVWTTVPAIVMAALVAIGLKQWFTITSEAPAESAVVEITGKQFNWIVRYGGKDGVLGNRDFTRINSTNNVLGLDTADTRNLDDVVLENGELHVEVNKPVKLIIGSRDVIHDVGLPHFRMKMDAVPGITSTLWFTPSITTEEMKLKTGNPNFVYEIACDQMCGKGHYSMRGTVIVESHEEHMAWLAKQAPYLAAGASATPSDSTTNGAQPQAAADSTKTVAKN